MSVMHRRLLTLCATVWSLSAQGATFQVDDSRTRVGKPVVEMKWRQFAPRRAIDHTMEGQVPVSVHLNLAPWVSRPARIYMALSQAGALPVQAQWGSQGRLLGGSLRSGGRALVFEGVITQAVLEDNILLTLSADGRELPNLHTLQFSFEIDVGS